MPSRSPLKKVMEGRSDEQAADHYDHGHALCGNVGSFRAAQPAISPLTIRGDLLTIKGDAYVVRDSSGVLKHLGVDKDTKKVRLIVPGERIAVQVSSDGRAISIKPVQ